MCPSDKNVTKSHRQTEYPLQEAYYDQSHNPFPTVDSVELKA